MSNLNCWNFIWQEWQIALSLIIWNIKYKLAVVKKKLYLFPLNKLVHHSFGPPLNQNCVKVIYVEKFW